MATRGDNQCSSTRSPGSHEAAAASGWPERLAHDAKLLAFPFDFGSASIDASVTAEDFQAEYLRLFEIGNGSGPSASNYVAGALAS